MVNITDEQNGYPDGQKSFQVDEATADHLRQYPVHQEEAFSLNDFQVDERKSNDVLNKEFQQTVFEVDHGVLKSFGEAIEHIKKGGRAYRSGWNGKGMFIAYSPGMPNFPAEAFWSPANQKYAQENGGSCTVLPCLTFKTATGEILMGWLASQTDMLATDWCVE